MKTTVFRLRIRKLNTTTTTAAMKQQQRRLGCFVAVVAVERSEPSISNDKQFSKTSLNFFEMLLDEK